MPEAEVGHAGHEKAPNEGRKEGRNHEKSNQEKQEAEKPVINFVKNGVSEERFVLLPENSKVSGSVKTAICRTGRVLGIVSKSKTGVHE